MLRRIAKNSCRQVAHAGAALLFLAATPVSAQAPAPRSPAQFDPTDVYFQGYMAHQTAEKLEETGDYIGAEEKLLRASELFEAVRRYYPDWKPEMVKGRSEKNNEAEVRVQPLAQEQRRKNRRTRRR